MNATIRKTILAAAPQHAAYGAAKAGVMSLVRSAAEELGPYNIRVNAVCATMIRGPMADRFLATVPDRQDFIASLEREIPLGRLGTAQEVANAVLFLASDESSLITGHCLPLDGGVYAK